MCQNAYPGLTTSRMVCIGFMDGGKDSCSGDGGGPAVCNGVLQGIASWGHKCGEKYRPGVYTKICEFSGWIAEVMAFN